MISHDKFLKIRGIEEIIKYGLPMSKTIFIFDFKKQEKEIDNFIKNREYVAIRSDKKNDIYFCPHDLRCPRNKAKKLIRELISKGYAVIIHEQNHDPLGKDQNQVSGNILILKKYMLVELMKGEPLILLNRDGKVDEFLKIKRNDLKEIEHFGKRIIKKEDLDNILRTISHVSSQKIIEFTLRREGLICWQIRDDKTAETLEK